MTQFLITSFDTWLPHQPSNASDDLLAALIASGFSMDSLHLVRRIEVDFAVAPTLVLDQVRSLRPKIIVCCGMAEARSTLTLESNGKSLDATEILSTDLDLAALRAGLPLTEISDDAGNFVCNHLYYHLLKTIREQSWPCHGLFVHVPWLTSANQSAILSDFQQLLLRLQALIP